MKSRTLFQDRSIFDDALIAVITAIIGAVILLIFFASGAFLAPFAFGAFAFGGFLGAIAILAGFWVFGIISAIFLKHAYDKAAQRLNINAFATAGLLYLIGALTAIILIGFAILLIALIFQVVAYFSIEDRPAYAGVPPSRANIRSASAAYAATDDCSTTGSARLQVLSQMRGSTCLNSRLLYQLRHKTVVASKKCHTSASAPTSGPSPILHRSRFWPHMES